MKNARRSRGLSVRTVKQAVTPDACQRLLGAVLLLAFVAAPPRVRAQSTVSGRIVDERAAAVALANVQLLFAEDSTFVAGTVAGEDGTFELGRIAPGAYRLFVSLIGYRDHTSAVLEIRDEESRDLGRIVLASEAVEMEEVSVEARRVFYEQQGDRLVVNVANSLTLSGQSALDVLKRSPGVVVNEQSNSVSLVGKDGVRVMVNGKQSYVPADGLIQYLAGISADNLESIELITSPPARYDAEGNAGFINIILKESPDAGLNGSVTVSAGYGDGEVASASSNVTYDRGDLSVFGSYSFRLNGRIQRATNYRRIVDGATIVETPTVTRRDPHVTNHDLRVALDYNLNEKTTLGGQVGAYDHLWTMDAVNRMLMISDGTALRQIRSVNDEVNHWRHAMGNLYVDRRLGASGGVQANVDYVFYHDNNPTNYVNTHVDLETGRSNQEHQKSGKITPLHIFAAKADYDVRPTEQFEVSAGLKGSFSRFTNEASYEGLVDEDWITASGLASRSILHEDVLAAYGSANVEVTTSATVKAGVRYELTDTHLRSEKDEALVDRRFGSLFPSVAYSQDLAEGVQLDASYTRRITRPSFTDMAPFLYFIDPHTFFTGNAGLQASIINTYKVDFTYEPLFVSLQYSVEDSTIARFQNRIVKGDNVQLIFPRNYSETQRAAALIVLPIHPAEWWSTQNNLTLGWREIRGFSQGAAVTRGRTSVRLSSTQNFSLPKDFNFETTGYYQSATLLGLTRVDPQWRLDLGLQRSLPGGRGTLTLSLNDIFNSEEWFWVSGSPEEDFFVETYFDPQRRTLQLTYSLRFGDATSGSLRQTASSEERGRVQ